jgi:hypothetical protein
MFTSMQRVKTIWSSAVILGHLTFVEAFTTLINQLRVGNQKVQRWVGGGETNNRNFWKNFIGGWFPISLFAHSGWKEKSSEWCIHRIFESLTNILK